MRYSTFMGLLVVLLKQSCTSEGGPTPNQSNYSTQVTYQDGQTLPQDQKLTAAEIMPVVSPPSLKEVQQAVQEASEQVSSRGAGEVLKELLERVVEAALGHAEGGGEAKDEAAEKEEVNHEALGVKTGHLEAETLEQPVWDKNTNLKEEDAGFEEEAEAEADLFKDVAVGERGVVKGEVETAAESIEKFIEGADTGVREAETLEITDESPGTQLIEQVLDKASEETMADIERNEEISKELVMSSVFKNATEIKIQDKEETPTAVDVAVDVQSEQEIVDESKLGLGVADGEQTESNWGKKALPKEETPISELNGEIIALPSEDSEIKTTEPIVGETAEVGKVAKGGEYAEGREEANTNADLVMGGEATAETEATYFKDATADEGNDTGVIMEESVSSVNEGGDIQVGKEQTTWKNFHYDDVQESLIPGVQLEDSTEAFHRLENQPPTPNPSAGEVESEENTLWDENCDQVNEIITPTQDVLPHKHGRSQPTMDNFENDVLAEYHQAKGGEPREANQLVKDLPGIRETDEQGLKAWKIGAIFAAVFLVLETVIIIFYIVKCQKRKSTLAVQQVCEDGCDEPKAPTGRDCSDNTLSAGKGSTRQIATLNQADAASTPSRNREHQEDKHAIAMSNVSSSSKWEPSTSEPEPDS